MGGSIAAVAALRGDIHPVAAASGEVHGPLSANASNSAAPSAGRPRSEEAHKAILDATLELLVEVGFSGLTVGKHGTYVANAAATISDEGVRIALGCVGATPVRATAMEERLAGGDMSENSVRAAAGGLGAALDPPSDVHGSADYRRHLAEVSAVRAVLQAAGRGKGA